MNTTASPDTLTAEPQHEHGNRPPSGNAAASTALPSPDASASAAAASHASPLPSAEATPASAGLLWSGQLCTGDARMDDTHEAFVSMLNQLLATPPAQQLPLYRAFIDHTVEHFAQEERWMLATGFAPDNCHAAHHATILETMHAVVQHHEQGDTEIIGRLAEALVEWFPQHAASMDAGLALHMQSVGFDSRSETLADPDRIRPATMSGCGSVSCS